jgi:hypothetical protein
MVTARYCRRYGILTSGYVADCVVTYGSNGAREDTESFADEE